VAVEVACDHAGAELSTAKAEAATACNPRLLRDAFRTDSKISLNVKLIPVDLTP
jgi:hypothetical protein